MAGADSQMAKTSLKSSVESAGLVPDSIVEAVRALKEVVTVCVVDTAFEICVVAFDADAKLATCVVDVADDDDDENDDGDGDSGARVDIDVELALVLVLFAVLVVRVAGSEVVAVAASVIDCDELVVFVSGFVVGGGSVVAVV